MKPLIAIFSLKTSYLKIILGLFPLVNCIFAGAQSADSYRSPETPHSIEVIHNEDTTRIAQKPENKKEIRHKKIVAAFLCLALGPFGMHRLYLGTSPQVAAAYSATLGGIGVLPLIDFFAISFSKDLSSYRNNSKVIMWKK